MRNFTDSYVNIDYPDDTLYSGDRSILNVTTVAANRIIQLTFVIAGVTYNERYLCDSSKNIKINLSEIFDLIFTKSQNTAFDTDNTFSIHIYVYIDDVTVETDTVLSFANVMLGRRDIGDVIETIFDNNEYLTNVSNQYYFYMNVADNVYISIDNGYTWIDKGVFGKGIRSMDLNAYTSDILIAPKTLLSTFDFTFDFTFQENKRASKKIEFLSCTDEKTISLRYLNRQGLWKYKHGVRINISHGVNGSTTLSYDEGNQPYSDIFYQIDKKKNNSLNVIFENQNKEQIIHLKDLIQSEFISYYVNAEWLPCIVGTTGITLNEKENGEDIVLQIILQNEL